MSETKLEFNSGEQNFFSPINSDSYQDTIAYLKQHPITVAYKIDKSFIRSAFMYVEEADIAIAKTHESEYKNLPILCSFQLHGDQLFFRSTVTSKNEYLLINFPEKIYKIQRRQDYRLTLTPEIKSSLKIIELPKLDCKLINLSLGGCKIHIASKQEVELLPESELTVSFKIFDKELTTPATIVFTQFDKTNEQQIVSFKFSELDPEQISQLHQGLIKADRVIRHIDLN